MHMAFDAFSEYYNLMIDWDQRLAREMPFYKTVFAKYNVATVLDCACASGRHAVAFAKLGLEVFGSDISYPMLDKAQDFAQQEKSEVDFVYADFRKLPEYIPCQFDAILCVGNSLVQMNHDKEVLTTLRNMRRMLNPNGILIVQILNFSRLMKQYITLLPLRVAKVKGKELLFQRLYSFSAKKAVLSIITFTKQRGKWETNLDSIEMLLLTQPKLQQYLHAVGFRKTHFYGDFKFTPFHEDTSSDLIFVAHR